MKAIKKPEFMKNAILGKGHGALFEMVCAILIFIVGSVIMSFVEAPVMVICMLQDGTYMDMIRSGDLNPEKLMEVMNSFPGWLVIVNLVAEIALIVVCILYCKLVEKRKAHTMGFRKKGFLGQYAKGMLIGAIAFSLAYGLCVLTGSISFGGLTEGGVPVLYIIGFFIGFLIQGMAEEVLCRGYLMVSLTRRHSVVGAVIISSLFFAMLHDMNSGMTALSVVNLFLFGVVMSLMMIRYENIWIVGATHSIWNFMQGNVFGVLVSGQDMKQSIFASSSVEGAAFINGGAFGLEGGLSVTLILAAGIAFLIWSLHKKGAIIDIHTDIEFRMQEEQERVRLVETELKKKGQYQQAPYYPNQTPFYPNGSNTQQNMPNGFNTTNTTSQGGVANDLNATPQGNEDVQNENVTPTFHQTDAASQNKMSEGVSQEVPNGSASAEQTERKNASQSPNSQEPVKTVFDQSYFKD